LKSRKGAIIAITLSVIIIGGLVVLGPYLYDRLRRNSAQADEETAQPDTFEPLTHDEVLGAPLSFETPAFLRIPAVAIDEEVREGSDFEGEMNTILSTGPVHLPHTGFPGWPGNCVISGHRTTHTKPFNRLDELQPSDSVFIENPRGIYEYEVTELRYIDPSENVTLTTEETILTLTTCAPEGDATLRLVVRASLKGFTPVEDLEETPSVPAS
jgi:LPXTG-site transpeptidase (sortase) family protein